MAARLGYDEEVLRKSLYKYSSEEKLLNPENKVYLPAVGGTTVYLFGDIKKLKSDKTEIALRVHDECNGSDVFGTDICTCRPYLIYSIQAAVECAQRGGIGVVIYYRKEGRALGEVTKFRVYNARKRQEGGDRPEMYFQQTVSIAGIRDARVQEIMPDVILWLGIDRIEKLLSMSNDKYEAILGSDINVLQRVSLPEDFVPENAMVEISAKIASGYNSNAEATDEVVKQLYKIDSVRHICGTIFDMAKEGKTKYFNLDLSKIPETSKFVAETIKKNYPDFNIPYHSRWRHFENLPGEPLETITNTWHCSKREYVRRLIDLVTISVLLDAGAGPNWKYVDDDGNTFYRSEGLAVASIDMFRSGKFSSDLAVCHRVNSVGIRSISLEEFKKLLQHSKNTPLVAIEARYQMLMRLADALDAAPEIFGYDIARPGNIVNYIEKISKNNHVSLVDIFEVLTENLASIWPTNSPKIKKGDVWAYQYLYKHGEPGSDLVPIHKIPQWLSYSLCEPLERLGYIIDDVDKLTGLAEYRNGGLFIDFDVLTFKNPKDKEHEYEVGSEVVVEWRALTICLLEVVAKEVRTILGKTIEELPMPKVLQGGTWAAGRAIAKIKRADGGSPLNIRLNGITF